MSHNKRHTDHTGADPTAPLDDIDQLLTTNELAIVCVVLTMLTGVWLGVLAFVSGYAWERWLANFVAQATGWLLLLP